MWTAQLAYNKYTTANSTDLTAHPAHLSFSVKADTTGTYYIWARVSINATTNVWTYIDGNTRNGANTALTGAGWKYDIWGSADNCSADESQFIWVRIGLCNWEEGNTYFVRFRGRDGRRIVFDKFVVTMDNSYAPFLGDSLASFEADTVIEAEDTSLDMSRVAVDAGVVFMDKYVQSATDFRNAQGAPGAINFQVNTKAPGTYYIWANMTAKSSLYYSVCGSAYKGAFPGSTGWQKIGSYTVTEAGEVIVVRLTGRQANNKIDQFYVTADAEWNGQ